jgi:hypothetical protein
MTMQVEEVLAPINWILGTLGITFWGMSMTKVIRRDRQFSSSAGRIALMSGPLGYGWGGSNFYRGGSTAALAGHAINPAKRSFRSDDNTVETVEACHRS